MQVSKISFTQNATLVPQIFSSSEIVGNILRGLNRVTHSSILNTHDIPVVMRYVKNLAGTCQVLYRIIEEDVDFMATNIFLTSLSNKYDKPYEYFAARFNTPPCKQWLFKFIEEKGYRNYYNAIQDIFKLMVDVMNEAQDPRLEFQKNYHFNPKNYFHPIPSKQTKEGFILKIKDAPNSVVTPFGLINIYSGVIHSENESRDKSFLWPISELFIKHMDAFFYKASKSTKYLEIAKTEDFGTIREISEKDVKLIKKQDIETKKGAENLFIGKNYCDYTFYTIKKVNGISLPDVVQLEKGQKGCSKKLILHMWKLLENERMGLTSLVKQEEIKEVTIAIPSSPLFQNITEAAKWGTSIAEKIWEEGERVDTLNGYTFKTLAWKDKSKQALEEVKLMLTLNDSAKPKLIDSQWSIGRVSRGRDGESFQLCYKTYLDNSCSLEKLKETYASVIEESSKNWKMSTLKESPLLLKKQRKSEEDYQLFVKKNAIQNDTVLMNLFAETMNLSEYIIPFVQGKEEFLWIKKKNLTKVCKAFNIAIPD